VGGKSDAEPSRARQILPPTRACPAVIPSMPRSVEAAARRPRRKQASRCSPAPRPRHPLRQLLCHGVFLVTRALPCAPARAFQSMLRSLERSRGRLETVRPRSVRTFSREARSNRDQSPKEKADCIFVPLGLAECGDINGDSHCRMPITSQNPKALPSQSEINQCPLPAKIRKHCRAKAKSMTWSPVAPANRIASLNASQHWHR